MKRRAVPRPERGEQVANADAVSAGGGSPAAAARVRSQWSALMGASAEGVTVAEKDSKQESRQSSRGAADEVGAEQVQAAFDEANERGYFGESPDKTPRENYTVKGVGSGAPTPETTRQ